MTTWFDFDEWAALYQHDPAAFEARRQAVLALELARATPTGAARAKAALQGLESQLAHCTDAQRVQTAMTWMAASMRELSDSLQALAGTMVAARTPLSDAGQARDRSAEQCANIAHRPQ